VITTFLHRHDEMALGTVPAALAPVDLAMMDLDNHPTPGRHRTALQGERPLPLSAIIRISRQRRHGWSPLCRACRSALMSISILEIVAVFFPLVLRPADSHGSAQPLRLTHDL
jgi:hypothetical protein